MRVKVKIGAASAYLKSTGAAGDSQDLRETVASFLKQHEGCVLEVQPVATSNLCATVAAYRYGENWGFMPEDVEEVPE